MLPLLLSILLVACTGPESHYASKGYPDDRVVGSTRDVYNSTGVNDRLTGGLGDATLPGATARDGTPEPNLVAGEVLPPLGNAEIAELRRIEGQLRPGTARYDPTTFTPGGALTPVAVRPRTLRIWVAPWTDDAGDLVVAGYVFAGIDRRLQRGGLAWGPNHLQSVSMIEGQGGTTRVPSPAASPPPVQTRQAAFGRGSG